MTDVRYEVRDGIGWLTFDRPQGSPSPRRATCASRRRKRRSACPSRTLGNCLSMANLERLAALVGPGRVKELIFTARLLNAEEARAIGLVTEVTRDEGSLEPRAQELARTMAGFAPLTLWATKEALRRLRDRALPDGRDLLLLCYLSHDFREGIEAFLAKRKPEWMGE